MIVIYTIGNGLWDMHSFMHSSVASSKDSEAGFQMKHSNTDSAKNFGTVFLKVL